MRIAGNSQSKPIVDLGTLKVRPCTFVRQGERKRRKRRKRGSRFRFRVIEPPLGPIDHCPRNWVLVDPLVFLLPTSISTMMPPAAPKRGGVYGVSDNIYQIICGSNNTHGFWLSRFRARPCRGSNAVCIFRPSPSTIVVCSFLGMVPTLWLCVSTMDARLAFGRYGKFESL